MKAEENILVVGSGSRVGAALVQKLGRRAIAVCRRPAGNANEVVVDDYAALPRSAFERVGRVVNCVGVSSGPADLLERLNVTVPVRIAETAQAAGVKQIIHVSSFSVYGGAEWIDKSTATDPVGDYGRSKLVADDALLALAGPEFTVTTVRLPLIYASDSLGKLGRLLSLWTRVRILPVPSGDVSRSMISVEMAAEILARLTTRTPMGGVLFAADPVLFTYRDAARCRPEMLLFVPVPGALKRAALRISPELARRLLSDSQLADADNLALEFGLSSRLHEDIAAIKF